MLIINQGPLLTQVEWNVIIQIRFRPMSSDLRHDSDFANSSFHKLEDIEIPVLGALGWLVMPGLGICWCL